MLHLAKYRDVKRGGDKWQDVENEVNEEVKSHGSIPCKEYPSSTRIRAQGSEDFCYVFASMNVIESVYHLLEPSKPIPSICEDHFIETLLKNHIERRQILAPDFIAEHLNGKSVPMIRNNEVVAKGSKLAIKFKKIDVATGFVSTKSTIRDPAYIKSMLLKYGPLAVTFSVNVDHLAAYKFKEEEVYSILPHQEGKHGMHDMCRLEACKWGRMFYPPYGADFGSNGNMYLPVTDLKKQAIFQLAAVTYIESMSIGTCFAPRQHVQVEIGPNGLTQGQIDSYN